MPLMVITAILNRIETAPMPFFMKPIAKIIAHRTKAAYSGPNIRLNLDYLEATLQKSTWFCGSEMSGADIMMSFPIETAAMRTSLAENHPALEEFRQHVRKLPAYQRAIEKGGPYIY
jgi:glutathione S-transferase